MASKYASGRITEYKARNFLIEKGYYVLRSAGSKGAFDLIAWKGEVYRHIQVKRESKKSSYAKDTRQILSTKVPKNASRELWIYAKGRGWRDIIFFDKKYSRLVSPKK